MRQDDVPVFQETDNEIAAYPCERIDLIEVRAGPPVMHLRLRHRQVWLWDHPDTMVEIAGRFFAAVKRELDVS